ncbi:copper amine oxidase N-terminal domain-containing protein [Paenibacillus sp. 7541]|uniref:copper amine oxidase N-terminal domain-containing protein n=1 Tax=Paenibacillus sp. 7541 TaxID=2026236 RepID=UPI001595450F|nr:copper amine oxidase N-terminal domain-containing protein [Paenibacillus sp. 7541]
MKRILAFLVVILLISSTLPVTTQASESEEGPTVGRLILNASVKTFRQYSVAGSSGLDESEGAIRITFKEADFELFKGLSVDGKKSVMNTVAQNNWGDYLGVQVCYIVVIYNNKVYAVGATSNDAADSSISFEYYEQGSSNMEPWKDKSINLTPPPNGKPVVKTIDDKGVIIKNNTMLPAVQVVKNMGGSVQFDSKTKNITLKYQKTTMQAKLDSKSVQINDAKRSYAVAPQIIDGKLMLPLKMAQDLFAAKITVDKSQIGHPSSSYIDAVTLITDTTKLTVPVNDLYEAYIGYYGKTVWVHTAHTLISDLSGNYVNIKNLAQVKLTKVERNIGDLIDAYFVYKGKTYKAPMVKSDFKYVFYTSNPYQQYKFSQKHWRQIEEHTISTGMTSDMVYLSWGWYDQNMKNTYSWGTTEFWVYERSYGGDKYLYFVNDVLQSISTY